MLRKLATSAIILLTSVSFAIAQAPKKPAPAAKPLTAAEQLEADVENIFGCLEVKAPEDVPEKGPEREKVLAAAEGGPQSCIGNIVEACQKAKGKDEDCMMREARAWLASLELDEETAKEVGEKNVAVYKAAVAKIEENALAMCRAAASVSAWGSEAIKTDSKELNLNHAHPCMFDAIIQQALIILVNQRGG